jgi:hypothetical protein
MMFRGDAACNSDLDQFLPDAISDCYFCRQREEFSFHEHAVM